MAEVKHTPSAHTGKLLGWNDAIPFGKFKGLLVREVAQFNPQYLAWAVNNLEHFNLTDEARKLGQRELNNHREQSMQRQNGWAYGFGASVKTAADKWRSRMVHLEMQARAAAISRATGSPQ